MWCTFCLVFSGADVDRYFTPLEVTEADSNCDPDKVVSSVRKMMLSKQDDSSSKSAVHMLESALKISPHAEVSLLSLYAL